MSLIPSALLNKLYNRTSLKNRQEGVSFSVKNRLSPARLEQFSHIALNGHQIDNRYVQIAVGAGNPKPVRLITPDHSIDFPLGTLLTFHLDIEPLTDGEHDLELAFITQPFGKLTINIHDSLKPSAPAPGTIPRDAENDYSEAVITARQEFVRERDRKSVVGKSVW